MTTVHFPPAIAPQRTLQNGIPPSNTTLPLPPTSPPTPLQIQHTFDLAIALALSAWPALTLAVQNSWGGPISADKRDWFAGAISDLFSTPPHNTTSTHNAIDVDYLEEFLLQVMSDEFEVWLEDGSAAEVAARIVGLWGMCARGEFGAVEEMWRRWEGNGKGRKGGEVVFVDGGEGGDDEEEFEGFSSDGEEDEEEDEEQEERNGDIRMGEAEEMQVPKQKLPPEVDEDGFTKIVGRRRKG